MELFTMKSETLYDLVKGGMVASSKDKALPMLNTVKFEIREPLVRVVSTDRYRLVIGDVNLPEGTLMETCEFLLPLDSVKDLVKTLPSKANSGMVTVELSDDGAYVSFSYDGGDGKWNREYQTLTTTFVKYESIMPKEFVDTQEIGFNPALMADIAKLPTDKKTAVVMRFTGSHKPMVGTIQGTNSVSWTYLLMPMRLEQGE
jgi:DNA polymerase III sliding clamp (beta) subunit (PCNA family)